MNAISGEGVLDERAQAVAMLSTLTAKMQSEPAAVRPVADAFERVLDIASYAPGGWNALFDCLVASKSLEEVLAFCRAFTWMIATRDVGIAGVIGEEM